MRAAKVQASLRIRAVSLELPLLAHTSSESRGTFRQKARSLALLNGWACAVKICHDGMLEDTNSLDGAHFFLGHRIALPCCEYPLESHWRCIFNEYPQRVLWRNKQNYPLIITKHPPYLFHFLCAQQRLRSAWASAQSDQNLCCPLTEQLRSQGFFMRTAKILVRRSNAQPDLNLHWVHRPFCWFCHAAALFHILEFINRLWERNKISTNDQPFSFW